ncbi:MAG: Translation initiation factor IF-1 [candidate division WS6 bacterium GW2011_GWA2_37_6]|uniref:Translation initiation factor IF-1 n=1 Tax=candidate division WS6 bacterium GW2011_GWA2_37_6 TaxID=1619087 RepID=A0A0G0K5J6_9BACT|nr:MAG: Translation initiation factor IF-1 [candidate division WS6 bacterium GW2011_GWA2_37_6]
MKDTQKKIKVRGKISEVLPGTKFKVVIDMQGTEHTIFAYISGRMRMHYIKLIEGDEVEVELSPYDLTKGRITYRF